MSKLNVFCYHKVSVQIYEADGCIPVESTLAAVTTVSTSCSWLYKNSEILSIKKEMKN